MTCREAIREVFADETGVLTTSQVVSKIYARHPTQPWKKSSISAHLMGLSVNHPSSKHYPSVRPHAFLFSLGNGRYRRWDPDKDGTWAVTDTGVMLVDLDEVETPDGVGDTDVPSTSTAVSLERDLENCLLADLQQLEPGLRLYQEDDTTGHQFDTGVVGRLDILAVDAQGDYVVIELKAGEADERACGQILRYMGWVKRELAEGKPVRGVIVANSFTEKFKYAAEAMPGVVMKRYEVSFRFEDV